MIDWIEANGAVLRYEHRPSTRRPTLVLVHELGGSLESYDDMLAELPTDLGILRYDMRGAGLSEKLRGDGQLPVMSQDLHALIEQLGIVGPLVVVGCALGAAIAFHFAGSYRERCAGAVGLSAVIARDPSAHAEIRARADRIQSGYLPSVTEEVLARAFPPALRGDGTRFARQRARWRANDPDSLAALFRMLPTLADHAVLERIACPVLLVAASQDTMFPPLVQHATATKIRHVEVEELDTGHFPSVISPEPVAAAIVRFLLRLGRLP